MAMSWLSDYSGLERRGQVRSCYLPQPTFFPLAALGPLDLSCGGTNPIDRLGGSGGVMSWRSASKTCLSWARVLRLKVSCDIASESVFSSREASRSAKSLCCVAAWRSRTKARTTYTDTATVLDNAGSPATESTTFDGNTGRLATKTWPSNYQASYSYTTLGYLQTVTGGGTNGFTQTASYEVQAMNAQGQITQYRYANQTTSVKTIEPNTHRLSAQSVTSRSSGK